MKSAKLKQLAITLFGLIGLLCLGGYIAGKIYDGGIQPVVDLFGRIVINLISGESVEIDDELRTVLMEKLNYYGMYGSNRWPTWFALIQLREWGVIAGELFLAIPLVLIPVAAWLKNKRWAGLIAFVGLIAAALGMIGMAMGGGWSFWVNLSQNNLNWDRLFTAYGITTVIYLGLIALACAVVYWIAAAGFILLALSALFGYRPAFFFPLGAVLILPAVGLVVGNIPAQALANSMNYWEYMRYFDGMYGASFGSLTHICSIGSSLLDSLGRVSVISGMVASMSMIIGLLPTLKAAPLIGKRKH